MSERTGPWSPTTCGERVATHTRIAASPGRRADTGAVRRPSERERCGGAFGRPARADLPAEPGAHHAFGGLAAARLVHAQCDADVALAGLAEARAGRDHDAGRLQQLARELERAREPGRDRKPQVER